MVERHAQLHRITQWQRGEQRCRSRGDLHPAAVRHMGRAELGFLSPAGSTEHQCGLVHGVPCTNSY